MLKIGNLEFESNVLLAPMAGVTNQAFKEIVRSESDCIVCTEMVNDKALLNDNLKTKKMVEITEIEHPVSVQLFGSEVETMVAAAKYLDKHTSADIIDINMGCPAPKITKNSAGSKILLYPDKVYDILKNIVDNVDKPVTVKMRLGWNNDKINIVENALAAQKAGVSAITIHARTTKQYYSGKADWTYIKEIKELLDIPVIGNGDIDSPQKAKELMQYSKVDAIMVGRAAMGNPWLLHQIEHYIKTDELLENPTLEQKLEQAKNHLNRLVQLKGERIGTLEMRTHAPNYLKGIKSASKYKQLIQQASSQDEMIEVFEQIIKIYNSTGE